MNTYAFTRPATGYPIDDFQMRISELFLRLQTDLGGVERINDVLFRMFELAFPLATEQELKDFTKLQGAARCMNILIDEHTEAIFDLQKEQEEYDKR
ncbi:hypothetical protein [Chryseobacterium sp. FH1]|uniref:hypothetical protein n=1 Tax=Chryseobacterium sp. FH1 TaxID=1233951 RepID=UPI0004E2917F|nr:hypothetical protein [Chryseobacterium sp. FH1]KFC19378.1 hypothetical protein IO90_08740 [Chryseobacterium sp. FH1]